jgi:ParB-like chromosome segregation protein Spo0J
MLTWKLATKKVTELKENPKNPRNLTKKGLDDLEKSITKFGVAEPLVVNSDGMICGGHGRKKILERLNIKEVDCYLPSRKLTSKEFDELNIRLNKNIAGEFNFDILANEFELPDLLEWGFEERELGIEKKLKDLSDKLKNTFEVVIECVNEKEQEKTYNELSGKYQCRLLTL